MASGSRADAPRRSWRRRRSSTRRTGRRYSRNFRVVEDGVLYRSGQLSPAGLDRVDPRARHQDGRQLCARTGPVRFVGRAVLHARGSEARSHRPAGLAMRTRRARSPPNEVVQEFLDVMDEREELPGSRPLLRGHSPDRDDVRDLPDGVPPLAGRACDQRDGAVRFRPGGHDREHRGLLAELHPRGIAPAEK